MKRIFEFKSIKTRFIFWFLFIALLPLLTASVIIYYQRVDSIKEEAFKKITAIRDLKVLEINRWLNEMIGDIRVISSDFEIRDLEDTFKKTDLSQNDVTKIYVTKIYVAKELLKRNVENLEAINNLSVISFLSGKIELSCHNEEEGEDQSKEEYFTEPMRKYSIQGCFRIHQ